MTLQMSQDIYAEIELMAELEGISKGDVIRGAIEKRVAKLNSREYITKLYRQISANQELLERMIRNSSDNMA